MQENHIRSYSERAPQVFVTTWLQFKLVLEFFDATWPQMPSRHIIIDEKEKDNRKEKGKKKQQNIGRR